MGHGGEIGVAKAIAAFADRTATVAKDALDLLFGIARHETIMTGSSYESRGEKRTSHRSLAVSRISRANDTSATIGPDGHLARYFRSD